LDVVLLNVMGSAAVASAVIVGLMTTRLSRAMAGSAESQPEKPNQGRSDP